MAVLVQDSFTVGSTVALHGRTPEIAPAGVTWFAATGTWVVHADDYAFIASVLDRALAIMDAGVSDKIVLELDVTPGDVPSGAARAPGIVVRLTDANNYWRISVSEHDDQFAISERNGGTETVRASANVTIDIGQTYKLRVMLSETSITATLDGGNEISYSSAFNQSATIHGMTARSNTDRLDNWLIETLEAGSPAELEIDSAAHGHTAETAGIGQAQALGAADSGHDQSVDSPALTQAHGLSIAGNSHNQAADDVFLAQVHNLTVADATHPHAPGEPALLQAQNLSIASAHHGHQAETAAISGDDQPVDLMIASTSHTLTVGEPALSQRQSLSISGGQHAQAAESLSIDQAQIIAIAGGLHSHRSDELSLTGPVNGLRALTLEERVVGRLVASRAFGRSLGERQLTLSLRRRSPAGSLDRRTQERTL